MNSFNKSFKIELSELINKKVSQSINYEFHTQMEAIENKYLERMEEVVKSVIEVFAGQAATEILDLYEAEKMKNTKAKE